MYVTSTLCRPAGALHGPMVVSMRPLPAAQIPRAVLVTNAIPILGSGKIDVVATTELAKSMRSMLL